MPKLQERTNSRHPEAQGPGGVAAVHRGALPSWSLLSTGSSAITYSQRQSLPLLLLNLVFSNLLEYLPEWIIWPIKKSSSSSCRMGVLRPLPTLVLTGKFSFLFTFVSEVRICEYLMQG
ncbi:Protein Armcx6 [Manis pentadactyla]|nr:Protein Armcx6 [Manis pentadactyla]